MKRIGFNIIRVSTDPFRTLFLLSSILLSASFVQPEAIERGYPRITNYNPKEYRADTQNWAVVQDRRGVMYFANNMGLLEFDGSDWRIYSISNGNTLRCLALSEDGSIFAGGIGDLGYFRPDSSGLLSFHSLLEYLPEDVRDFSDVWQVLIHNEVVYFNVDKYIFIWDIQNRDFKTIQGSGNFHLLFLVDGRLYARQWGVGLQQLKGEALVLLEGGGRFADERVYVVLPFPGEEETLLIGTRDLGLFKYRDGRLIPFKTEADHFLQENLIYYPGLILADGNILLPTLNDGVVIIDSTGRQIEQYNRKSGLLSPVVYSQLQARSGAIWLTTDNGISRIDYSSDLSYFDSRNNFFTTASQLIRHQGTIYAATNSGVYSLDPETSMFHQLSNSNNQSVVFSEVYGELLVGTLDGLFRVDEDQLTPIRRTLASEYDVNAILHSNTDPRRLFIGAVGLWSLYRENGHWRDEGNILNFEDIANSIEENEDGSLWVGTNASGLFKIVLRTRQPGQVEIANPSIRNFGKAEGIPPGAILVKKINDVNYFLSAEHFYRYDEINDSFFVDDRLRVVSNLQNYVSPLNIREDRSNRLWISMGREPALGTPHPDGTYDWLKAPFRRLANEIVVSIYPETRELVWFSTSTSIIRVDLSKTSDSIPQSQVLIRRVELARDAVLYHGDSLTTEQVPKIPFQLNSIRFSFAAPAFEADVPGKYRTFLDGNDQSWSSWSEEHRKEYTNLAPGRYTFKVVARNLHEVDSRPATYTFEILPPWYRSWPAYFLYALILAGAALAVDRFQRKRLLAKQAEKMKIQQAEHRAETAELQARAAEVESELIQLEHRRKTEELEEARRLQLSMLPGALPSWPGLEISVSMQTATEVGGDYYDFSTDQSTRIVAIGDATGHGMKAGIMVSGMKSIFTTNASKMDIESFFRTAGNGIKGMGLQRMMMSFAMLFINGKRIDFINAGMPPFLHYKRKIDAVEEVKVHAAPLGAMENIQYRATKIEVSPGDLILLMSDGMPEMQNDKGEFFGYERITAQLKRSAERSPDLIIENLYQAGSAWMKGEKPKDDLSFVLIKWL